QPDYPKALGPVFVGTPYLNFPKPKASSEPAYLMTLDQAGQAPASASTQPLETRPGSSLQGRPTQGPGFFSTSTYASNPPGSSPQGLGGSVNLLA
ncbi:MAG TPA: hypothetical protein VF768_11920, partial [Holophagaceae bacterium]